MKYKCTN